MDIEQDGKHARVRADVAESIAEVLFSGKGCTPMDAGGRGAVARFAYPGGEAILRRYLRGGVMRHFLRESYLVNRPLREFGVHLAALEAGLAVPPLLGVCWWRRGPLLRGAIATGALDASHLQAWLARREGEATEIACRCGMLIRAMHDAGIWHADLQLRNLLVAGDGPYLIDFDGARCLRSVPRLQRARNLLRLRRSIEKNGADPAVYAAILAGYGGPEPPRWLGTVYALKGVVSDRIPGSRRHV